MDMTLLLHFNKYVAHKLHAVYDYSPGVAL